MDREKITEASRFANAVDRVVNKRKPFKLADYIREELKGYQTDLIQDARRIDVEKTTTSWTLGRFVRKVFRLRDFTHMLSNPNNVIRKHARMSHHDILHSILILAGRDDVEFELTKHNQEIHIPVKLFCLQDRNHEDHEFDGLTINFTVDRDSLGVTVTGPDYADSGYCHPHVGSFGHICLGDAREVVETGLMAGDVLAIFDIVESLLHTYNPGSPHFSLETVYGTPCHECGDTVDEDDQYYCENCAEYFCRNCALVCACGRRTLCTNCSSTCSCCGSTTCGHCGHTCSECGDNVCGECSNSCEHCDSIICDSCESAHDCESEEEEEEDDE